MKGIEQRNPVEFAIKRNRDTRQKVEEDGVLGRAFTDGKYFSTLTC